MRTESSNVAHRDIYRFKGVDSLANNTLCVKAVFFVNITNIQSVQPEGEDSQTHVLIRWLESHPDSFEHDQLMLSGPFPYQPLFVVIRSIIFTSNIFDYHFPESGWLVLSFFVVLFLLYILSHSHIFIHKIGNKFNLMYILMSIE